MNRRIRTRTRQKQINILHTTTRKRHSRKQMVHMGVWCGLVLTLIVVVGVGLHYGISMVLDKVLYSNSHYALKKIGIDPPDHFALSLIRQKGGLKMEQNLWTLDLPEIARGLETIPNVSSAKVERHFPDKITIIIHERVPVVKIVGLSDDLNTRELYYLDREGFVLKPRADETVPALPEIIGLANAELEPGAKLEQSSLAHALEILDAIDHTELHTTIDIRTINLSDPLFITMVTTRDMTITFRPDNVDEQLRRLLQIVQRPDVQQRTIHTVDLTPNYNVPVTFYE